MLSLQSISPGLVKTNFAATMLGDVSAAEELYASRQVYYKYTGFNSCITVKKRGDVLFNEALNNNLLRLYWRWIYG